MRHQVHFDKHAKAALVAELRELLRWLAKYRLIPRFCESAGINLNTINSVRKGYRTLPDNYYARINLAFPHWYQIKALIDEPKVPFLYEMDKREGKL